MTLTYCKILLHIVYFCLAFDSNKAIEMYVDQERGEPNIYERGTMRERQRDIKSGEETRENDRETYLKLQGWKESRGSLHDEVT